MAVFYAFPDCIFQVVEADTAEQALELFNHQRFEDCWEQIPLEEVKELRKGEIYDVCV